MVSKNVGYAYHSLPYAVKVTRKGVAKKLTKGPLVSEALLPS